MSVLQPGDKIDRYVIEGPLGEGGMGRVYRAHDERLDRRVALKVLISDGEESTDGRARLLREARLAATLDHPNVVGVFDVGEAMGSPYIVMELVQGRSLRAVAGDEAVSMTDKLRYLRDVAQALAAAHDAGLVHRDVKPENIIVRSDGRVKVLDFGIARRSRAQMDPSAPTDVSLATMTAEGVKIGTPMYMAPEQIRGLAVDGRSDQFAWGVTAYEVLTGKPPWSGNDSMEVMASVLTETPAELAGSIPAKARALILKALAKKPEERCASMQSVVRALDGLIDASAASASPASASPASPRAEKTPASNAPLAQGDGARPASTPPAAAHGRSDPPRAAKNYGPPPGLEGARGRGPVPLGAPDAPMGPMGPMGAPPWAQRPTLSRRYSPRELEEVLDRAIRMQPTTEYRYGEVVAAAREVGVDELTLRAAMRDLVRRGAVEVPPEERRRRLMGFFRHMGIWLVVSFGLFLLNAFDPSSTWWFQYTMIAWGIAVGIHAVRHFFASPRAEPRALNRRSADPRVEYDAHVVSTMLVAPTPRVRIGASPGSSASADTRAAEEELAEIEAELAQRNRAR